MVLGSGGAERGQVTAFEDDGGSLSVALGGPDGVIELSATRLEPPARLGALDAEAASARVAGRLQGRAKRRLDSPGHLARWSGAPCESAAVLRLLAASLEDGSLLLVGSQGAEADAPHGDERVSATLVEPEGAGVSEFTEALLSTQYDSDGAHVRANLELWGPDPDLPPTRGSATRISGGRVALGGGWLQVAFLRWSVDGRAGTGTYALWRR